MRIAFVGKGGSGKSTLTAFFSLFLANNSNKKVLVFDADINIHQPQLLGFKTPPTNKHLSTVKNANKIKEWLIGKNPIQNIGAFRKTTLDKKIKVADV